VKFVLLWELLLYDNVRVCEPHCIFCYYLWLNLCAQRRRCLTIFVGTVKADGKFC